MTTFRLITAAFFLTAIFAFSAFAQTGVPAAAPKIVYINVGAFDGDDKGVGGITKYTTAMNTLEAEFKPVNTDLQAMNTKYVALGNEIKTCYSLLIRIIQ